MSDTQLQNFTEADRIFDVLGADLFFLLFETIYKMKENRLYDKVTEISADRNMLVYLMKDGSYLQFVRDVDNPLKWNISTYSKFDLDNPKKDKASLFAVPPKN